MAWVRNRQQFRYRKTKIYLMKTYKIIIQCGMAVKSFTLDATDRDKAYSITEAIISDRWVITDIINTEEL